jgi:hypothetical protein
MDGAEIRMIPDEELDYVDDSKLMKSIHDSYGRCPACGGRCILRERRINGNDRCENGHIYPSRDATGPKSA